LDFLFKLHFVWLVCLQDVMVVGEPTLMGGEFGDEDERLITRLENNQFEGTGGGPEDEGSEQKYSTSPAWGLGDKKTPPTSQAGGPPPTSGPSDGPEIKTE
jgi:LIM domain-binding protein 1